MREGGQSHVPAALPSGKIHGTHCRPMGPHEDGWAPGRVSTGAESLTAYKFTVVFRNLFGYLAMGSNSVFVEL